MKAMNESSTSPHCFLASLLVAGILSVTPCWAAADTLDLDVTFIGDREIFLQDAHKQLHWPEPANLKTTKPTFSFSMLPKRMNVQPEWSKNGPIRLRVSEPLRRLYKGHIQAGLGNYISPTLNFSYTDLRSKKGTWGLRGNHDSSRGGYASNDSIDDNFSSSRFSGWGKRFIGTESVEMAVDYGRQTVGFFGGNPEIWAPTSLGGRTYNTYTVQLNAHNFKTKKQGIQHHLSASYQFLSEDGINEHNTDLRLKLKTAGHHTAGPVSDGLGKLPFSMELHANIDRFNRILEGSESPALKQAILDFHPQVELAFGKIQTKAGVAFWIDAQGNKPFMVVPEIEAYTSLLRDLFIPYIKIDGGVNQNRYQSLLQSNPFLSSNLDSLENTYQKLHLQAGIRGSITKAFTFNLSAHHHRYDQFLFWGPDAQSTRDETFAAIYLDMNTTTLQADGSWRVGDSFSLTGQIKQNNYRFKEQENGYLQPWNLPTLQTKLGAVYTWKDKVRIGSQLELLTGRKGLQSWSDSESITIDNGDTFAGFETPLGASTQWDVQLEYLYNGRLSGWIHLQNLLNQANLFLPGYNSQKFRFQMGINYAF